mgnify:CR=1 FL=1
MNLPIAFIDEANKLVFESSKDATTHEKDGITVDISMEWTDGYH